MSLRIAGIEKTFAEDLGATFDSLKFDFLLYSIVRLFANLKVTVSIQLTGNGTRRAIPLGIKH